MDMSVGAIRLLSAKQRIDRVVISNLTGTVRGGYIVNISHWLNPSSLGNVGSVIIDNLNVDCVERPGIDADMGALMRNYSAANNEYAKEYDGGIWPPSFSVNCRVESLILRNVTTKVTDDHPVLRVGPDAHVGMMNAELSLYDPHLQGTPVQLESGCPLDRLNLNLNWQGSVPDQGNNPISFLGGVVGQLHWVETPPMYVVGGWDRNNTLAVRFSQDVKAIDFRAGASIKVNGKSVRIIRVSRRANRKDVVEYVLESSARSKGTYTWSYDAAMGNIQNLSVDQLLSVSDKTIN